MTNPRISKNGQDGSTEPMLPGRRELLKTAIAAGAIVAVSGIDTSVEARPAASQASEDQLRDVLSDYDKDYVRNVIVHSSKQKHTTTLSAPSCQ